MRKLTERVGESRPNRKGRMMTVSAYRSAKDIDVAFDDGEAATGVTWQAFASGHVAHPADKGRGLEEARLGERRRSNSGEVMEIVRMRGPSRADVRFPDGTVRRDVAYGAFERGSVAAPGKGRGRPPGAREGETALSSGGEEMTIVAYRGCRDIDVMFEDGTVRRHAAVANFRKGKVAKPAGKE